MVSNQFYPRKAFINAITNAQNAVVTFTANHDYIVGEIVSFRVTANFGMFELNRKRGKVLSITADTITVDIDTSLFTPFSFASINTLGTTPPLVVPSSSGVIPNQVIPQTSLDDAFDNRRV